MAADRLQPTFVGVAKMTMASTDPVAARRFAVQYLHATYLDKTARDLFPGEQAASRAIKSFNTTCGTSAEWVAFQSTKLMQHDVPTGFRDTKFDRFQLHFVRHRARPSHIPIAVFEEVLAAAEQKERHLDVRVVFDASGPLHALVALLQRDAVPHSLWHDEDGFERLWLRIPHCALCGVDIRGALARSSAGRTGPWPLTPRRFVYTSRRAAEDARFVATYAGGELVPSAPDGPDGSRITHTVRWASQGTNASSFEFEWRLAKWKRALQPIDLQSQLDEIEMRWYARELGVNNASANNWDHTMDYHSGLLFADCKPMIERLLRDHVPFFLTPHTARILGVLFSSPGGQLHEHMCPITNMSAAVLRAMVPGTTGVIDTWEWCIDPRTAQRETVHGLRRPDVVDASRPQKVTVICETPRIRVTLGRELRAGSSGIPKTFVPMRYLQFRGNHTDGSALTKSTTPWRFNEAKVQCVPSGDGASPAPQWCTASVQAVDAPRLCQPCPCVAAPTPNWDGGFGFLARMADVLLAGRCIQRELSIGLRLRAALPFRLLVVGLGGGALPTYAQQQCGAIVDVVEAQADVLGAASHYFGFSRKLTRRVIVDDGLRGLRTLRASGRGVYDAIMVDCMIHGEIPQGCKSGEFVRLLSELLKPDGAVAQWSWGVDIDGLLTHYGTFFVSASVNRTLFPHRRGPGPAAGLGVVEARGPRLSP